MKVQVKGCVVKGLRAASGQSRKARPGTIALQIPHFRAAIPEFDSFFDGRPHIGTLNVAVPRHSIQVGSPAFRLSQVTWERGLTENFFLSPCILRFSGKDHRGLIYIPDPETKPAGLPVGQVLEILTTKVRFIHYGSPVRVSFDAGAVNIVRKIPAAWGAS